VDAKYAVIERAYHGDTNAAREIMEDPMLPAPMKQELQRSLTAQPSAPAATASTLATIRNPMTVMVNAITQTLERGTKVAFSNAITGMLQGSLIIVFIGMILVLFIPEVPLRREAAVQRSDGEPTAEHVHTLEH
jgi:hypothetical protein